jgi:hypothetical protein
MSDDDITLDELLTELNKYRSKTCSKESGVYYLTEAQKTCIIKAREGQHMVSWPRLRQFFIDQWGLKKNVKTLMSYYRILTEEKNG